MQSVPTQIYKAISEDDFDKVKGLMSDNPDHLNVHTFMAGQTWLGYAAQSGKVNAVKALVEMGADLNIGDRTYGAKPLCSTCDNGHSIIAEYLIRHGSDLDTETSVRNPLFASIVGRSTDCVRAVLNAGIDATITYNTDTMTNMDAVAFALMRGENECAVVIAKWKIGDDRAAIERVLSEADEIAERNARA